MPLLHLGEQLKARFAGHADVGDQHLRLAARERLQHLVRRGERLVRNAFARERLLEHPADRAVVVDDPDGVAAHAGAARQDSLTAFIARPRARAAAALDIGSSIVNTVRPVALSHSIVPPCCVMNVCAIVSPSPLPPSRPETSGKKMRSRRSLRNARDRCPRPRSRAPGGDALLRERHAARDARHQPDLGRCDRLPASACAALRTMLSAACMQLLGIGVELGQARVEIADDRNRRELRLHDAFARARGPRGC